MFVFGGTDGGLSLCSASGPAVSDGMDPHGSAGQDHRSSNLAAHVSYKGQNDGAHWEEKRANRKRYFVIKSHLLTYVAQTCSTKHVQIFHFLW